VPRTAAAPRPPWRGRQVPLPIVLRVGPFRYLAGGLAGAAIAAVRFGVGNVVTITAPQHRIPRARLGRTMSALMLASVVVFPLGVGLASALVPVPGPQLLFPVGAAVTAAAILGALSQAEIREL